MHEPITLKPLGWLRSDFQQKFGTPRQGFLAKNSRATVELSPEWKGRGIFSGLEGFSHAWILSFLHLSQNTRIRGKIHPPRLRGTKTGILASRSPHRPNNIGLTLARVLACEGDRLILGEVDLVDGTPILDIKPYVAEADRPETYSSGWLDQACDLITECEFTEEARKELRANVSDPERIQNLIYEMISNDPRPPAYLKREPAEFAVWVAGLNVKFRYQQNKFIVHSVERT